MGAGWEFYHLSGIRMGNNIFYCGSWDRSENSHPCHSVVHTRSNRSVRSVHRPPSNSTLPSSEICVYFSVQCLRGKKKKAATARHLLVILYKAQHHKPKNTYFIEIFIGAVNLSKYFLTLLSHIYSHIHIPR